MSDRHPHLPPHQQDVWRIMYGTVTQIDAIMREVATEVERIVRSYPDRPLTEAERLSMLRRIDRHLEYRFGLTRGRAIQSQIFGVITRATDAAAEAPFRRLLTEIERGVAGRDPGLWNRIHASLMRGGMGPQDRFAHVYATLNGPRAQRQRFLRSGLMDPQRRWVDADGYRLSDRVWRDGQRVRREIDRRIVQAIRDGTGPVTLAKDLERFLNPSAAPTQYRRNGRIVRRNMTNRPTGAGWGSAGARRLARTEIQRVHHAATVEAARAGVPGLVGVKWNLSLMHPKVDVCDDLAHANDYGLGRGVYPPERVPTLPHPNCLCTLTPAMKPRQDVIDELIARYG